MHTNWARNVILVGALLVLAAPAHADSVTAGTCNLVSGTLTCTASNGSLSGSATFTINGSGQLVVNLTNTSTTQVANPGDVLTALFFNLTGATLSAATASASGSLLCTGSSCVAGGNLAGYWAYSGSLAGSGAGGTSSGLSAVGFGLFGPPDLFPPPILGQPDGVDYGIANTGFDGSACGTNNACTSPLAVNSVTLTLNVASGTLDLGNLSDTNFVWGTSLPSPVPEPATMALFGTGLLGVARVLRRRSSSQKK